MYQHLSGASATAQRHKEQQIGYVFVGGETILGPAAAALARKSGEKLNTLKILTG